MSVSLRESKIILASASPRRRELLEQVGVKFEIVPSKGKEIIKETEPDRIVMQLSADKAGEVAAILAEQGDGEAVVIGADTVVVNKGRILGKPFDEQDAFNMISGLRNGCHYVYTGVTIIYKNIQKSFAEKTQVRVCDMTDAEIWEYIGTGECMDKAGAYGIQGRFAEYVTGIDGDYNNVVGLPVARLMQELKTLF
ncbi:MAG: septum formation protein Maf [Butyrivibrio sp.]|nr:septum formation protein Maf [Butyrivibrio sp.]